MKDTSTPSVLLQYDALTYANKAWLVILLHVAIKNKIVNYTTEMSKLDATEPKKSLAGKKFQHYPQKDNYVKTPAPISTGF